MNIKVVDITRAIKDIEKLELDLHKIGMRSTPDIVGFYGELLVWKELKSKFDWQGYKIGLGSGQSRADILLTKNNKRINIEVKTSRLKNEWYGSGYGVALNIKKCKNQEHQKRHLIHPKKGEVFGDFCYFDYLVFVKIGDNLNDPKFYIFSQDYLYKNEESLRNFNKRFSSATHRIIFIQKKKYTQEITKLDLIHTKNSKKFQNKWSLIK